MQPKKTKSQTQGPTGLYELFLLTVPIEEVMSLPAPYAALEFARLARVRSISEWAAR